MGNLGAGEILLILAIVLLIFGPSKLSSMGKGLGEGLKNFKKGLSQDDKDEEPKPKDPPPKAADPPKTLTADKGVAGEPTSPTAVPETGDADTANVPRRDG
jgi:sec-independent protein translocase protein TatA